MRVATGAHFCTHLETQVASRGAVRIVRNEAGIAMP